MDGGDDGGSASAGTTVTFDVRTTCSMDALTPSRTLFAGMRDPLLQQLTEKQGQEESAAVATSRFSPTIWRRSATT